MENVFSMLTLRGMEYILAFLLVPYLLSVLGPTNYGAIAFMQGVMAYYNLFIDFGFNLTAPRAVVRAKRDQLSTVFSTYLWAKTFLWIVVSVTFTAILVVVTKAFSYAFDYVLFGVIYLSVLGNILFPVWFFQGIQQMRYITIINLLGRFVTIGCIFLVVKSEGDYIWAAFFQSCTPLIAGALSVYFIHREYPGILQKPDRKRMMAAIRESKQIFLSNLSVNLYTTSDIILLGLLTNNTIVGYYSGADKLIGCVKRGIGAINDAVYPYISQRFMESREGALHFLKKQFYVYIVGGIFIGFFILILSPYVIPWLLGERYVSSIMPLQILSFVPLIVAMSNIFGYETMLPLGMEKDYSRTLLWASILNLIMICPLILLFQENGPAIATVVTETFVTAVMGTMLWKKGIWKYINPINGGTP